MSYTEAIQNLEDAIQEIDYLQNEGCIIEPIDFSKLQRLRLYLDKMTDTMDAFGQVNGENVGKLDFSKLNITAE